MAPFCRGVSFFIDKRNFFGTDLFGDQNRKKGGYEFSRTFFRQNLLKSKIMPFYRGPDVTAPLPDFIGQNFRRFTSYIDWDSDPNFRAIV
jgi:hypothetical protein